MSTIKIALQNKYTTLRGNLGFEFKVKFDLGELGSTVALFKGYVDEFGAIAEISPAAKKWAFTPDLVMLATIQKMVNEKLTTMKIDDLPTKVWKKSTPTDTVVDTNDMSENARALAQLA